MITIYEFAGCSTCRNALKFLNARGVEYHRIPIVDEPPDEATLRKVLARVRARGGDLKNLFNTSGERYRALKMGERLKAGLSESEALRRLAKDGKLIKRPVLITALDAAAGFNEVTWTKLLDAN